MIQKGEKKKTGGKECCYRPECKLGSSQFTHAVMRQAALFWIDKAAWNSVFNTDIPTTALTKPARQQIGGGQHESSLTGNQQQRPRKS